MSAMLTAGHGPGSRAAMSMSPDSARHHASALGVAAVSQSASGSRAARSSATSRECMRGGPGGLWAASCSSSSTKVAGGGSGASRAERVPAARRADPSRNARQAAARSSSGTPESSLTTRSIFASRCAHFATVSTSAAITSAVPFVTSSRSSSRFSRPAPIRSSGLGEASGLAPRAVAGTMPASALPGGGRSAAHVDPTDERLCAAIQPTSSSCAVDSTGSGSTRRASGLSCGSVPSRRATTMPTRAAPRSGARVRCPGASVQPSGTR